MSQSPITDIRIEETSATQHLAVVHRKAAIKDLPAVIPPACGLVWNAIKASGIKGGRHVGVYFDCADGEMNLDVGAEVESPFPGAGEVVASTLPTGRVVAATLFGPYNGLPAAHKAIREWCNQHGYAVAGTTWEIYGHWTEACDRDPSKIRTDIFYLLK